MYQYGVLFALSSRILSGEIKFNESQRQKLLAVRDGLKEVSHVVGGFSATNPGSWFEFGVRVLENGLEHKTHATSFEWLAENGFGLNEDRLPLVWAEVARTSPQEVVCRTKHDHLIRVKLPNGSAFVFPGEVPDAGKAVRFGQVHLPSDAAQRRLVYEGVAEHFWANRQAVMYDQNDDMDYLVGVDLGTNRYHGEHLKLIETMQRFRQAGLRRNILLQGKPGTGKSTFCQEAARRLSRRTIILSAEGCQRISASEWHLLLELLTPEMIILDDVDRISEFEMETKLRMFEEGVCEVPFVLFTSNDFSRLPQPMRRPGRIDLIIKMDEATLEVLETVIAALAERVDIAIPEDQMRDLVLVAQNLSTAHVVEVMRRAKVDGWDATPTPGDITFKEGFLAKFIDPKDNNSDDDVEWNGWEEPKTALG